MKAGDLVEFIYKQYVIFEFVKRRNIGLVCRVGSDKKGHYISVYYANEGVWRWHMENELRVLQRVAKL